MFKSKINKPKFSLYHLDEGELYIIEFLSNIQCLCPTTNKIEKLKGNIHLATRSIIFEPENNKYKILKFPFKYFEYRPQIKIIDKIELFKFNVSKFISIVSPPIYAPYKLHDMSSNVFIEFLYEKMEHVAEIIFEIYDKFLNKQNLFEFDSVQYLGTLYNFQFDYKNIKGLCEKFLLKKEITVKRLLPLLEIPGMLMITEERIYFEPVFKFYTRKFFSIKLSRIIEYYKRKVTLNDTAFELISTKKKSDKEKKSLFLIFNDKRIRDTIYDLIDENVKKMVNTHGNKIKTNITDIKNYVNLWVNGEISNYEYLTILNSAANRSKNNISQYPIFPWVLSNYTSDELNLSDLQNFRDLSKPIGALKKERLEKIMERFNEMPEPKFMYGTHYSNSAYVIGYLIRKYPEYMLKLHSGKFDHPDRLFFSIPLDWEMCGTFTVKELIPEFYEDDDGFLKNEKHIEFERTSTDEKIDDVILPKWAKNTTDFLDKMKKALESDYVNEHLNEWIDLIFGYKQKGKKSIESFNVFHPLCYGNDYKNSDDLTKVELIQMYEFGQVPEQLFTQPHPKKITKNNINIIENIEDNNNIIDNIKNEDIDECNKASNNNDDILKNDDNMNNNDNKTENKVFSSIGQSSMIEKKYKFPIHKRLIFNFNSKTYKIIKKIHKKSIISLYFDLEKFTIISSSCDGYIKIYDIYSCSQIKNYFIQEKAENLGIINYNCNNFSNKNDKFESNDYLIVFNTKQEIYIMSMKNGKIIRKIQNMFNIKNIHLFNEVIIADSIEGVVCIWNIQANLEAPVFMCFIVNKGVLIDSAFNNKDLLYYTLCKISNDSNELNRYSLLIYNYTTDNLVLVYSNILSINSKKISKIDYNYSDTNLILITYENGIMIFDIRKDEILKEINITEPIIDIFSDSKSYLIISNYKLLLYNVEKETKEVLMEYKNNITFAKLIYRQNKGKNYLLIGNEEGEIIFNEI